MVLYISKVHPCEVISELLNSELNQYRKLLKCSNNLKRFSKSQDVPRSSDRHFDEHYFKSQLYITCIRVRMTSKGFVRTLADKLLKGPAKHCTNMVGIWSGNSNRNLPFRLKAKYENPREYILNVCRSLFSIGKHVYSHHVHLSN